MRKSVFSIVPALLLGAFAAQAQTPAGTTLNLAGYKPTLIIDPSQPPVFLSGEQPWWGPYQLAPAPYTLSNMALYEGLPPNAAWAATLRNGIHSAPSYESPFWSGYSGEAEAYPNADTSAALVASARTNAPISYTNGVIELTASPMTAAESETLPSALSGRGFVSGAINTYPNSQEYGYFEESAQVPSGNGFWPAFWMVPENMNPNCAPGVSCDTEIDVMEILGTNTHVLYSTLHTSDRSSPSYPSLSMAYTAPNGQDLSKAMHRYGVDWEPDYVTFYLDGKAFYSMPTPADMHQPMYIISNLAIGTANTWAGPAKSANMTGSFQIEAIRAWSSPNTVAVTPVK